MYCVDAVPVSPSVANVATPEDAVAVSVPTIVPPADTDAVTTMVLFPVTVLPFASRTVICGWTVNADPAGAPDAERVTAIDAATPGVPVAVNVIGDPPNDPDVAVRVFDPAVVPRVQTGEVAMPELFVDTVPAVASDPPPVATANVTETLGTGFPATSVTRTAGAVATDEPAVALCALPLLTAIVVAAPGPLA